MDRQGESYPHHLLWIEMTKLFIRRPEDNKKAGENIHKGLDFSRL